MAKNEAPAAEAGTMSQADLIALAVESAVTAALKATEGKRQMTQKEIRAKVQALKSHTGEFAKKALPAEPPPGHAIFTDPYGNNPKMVEAHRFMEPGARAMPFSSEPGDRQAPVVSGTYLDSFKKNERQLQALCLYPDGVMVDKKGKALACRDLLPSFGTPDNPVPFTAYFNEVKPGLFVRKGLS